MTMAVSALLFAAPALADSAVDVPVRGEVVKGQVVVPPSELSFTGASITLWMVSLRPS
jgi:hypothetical protein